MKTKLFLIIICVLFPVIAEGEDWIKICDMKDFNIYIGSIQQVASNQYRVWYKVKLKNDEEYSQWTMYNLYDCNENKLKQLQLTSYRHDGTTVTIEEQEWRYPIPSATSWHMMFIACHYDEIVPKLPKNNE